VRASFTSDATRSRRATLTIVTRGARSGRHRIRLLARSGERRALTAIYLVIRPPNVRPPVAPHPISPTPTAPSPPRPADFTIRGDLSQPLQPGRAVPLDLALTNPGRAEVTISGLDVRVAAIRAPRSDRTYPCGVDDFSVTQFAGAYGFTLPPSSTSTLSALGVPPQQWPQVAMLNRLANQNGCKGASLQLQYTGTWGAP